MSLHSEITSLMSDVNISQIIVVNGYICMVNVIYVIYFQSIQTTTKQYSYYIILPEIPNRQSRIRELSRTPATYRARWREIKEKELGTELYFIFRDFNWTDFDLEFAYL